LAISPQIRAKRPFLWLLLKETGFVEGQNVRIEYRSAEGRYDRLPALGADLVDRRVAVLIANGGPSIAKPAGAATSTIPIVFQGGGSDPVKEGLVASLAHPGGNVTGVMNLSGSTLTAKQVEVLRAMLPTAPSVGLLVNDTGPGINNEAMAAEAARALQWEVHAEYAHDDRGLETAFARLTERGVGGLVVVGDAFFVGRRARIVALAARYAIPASCYFREFVLEGGLMSYDPDLRETNRIAGKYVGRILKARSPPTCRCSDPVIGRAARSDRRLGGCSGRQTVAVHSIRRMMFRSFFIPPSGLKPN
jgi:putative tryptophan/tyrosine transport system substrate-binding protein